MVKYTYTINKKGIIMKREFAVIGLVRFGGSICEDLIIKDLGINNIDHVIVAIGDNIQASILTTVILTDLNVKKITVKAQNDYHEKILKRIGADHVVHPERDTGRRLAHSLISSNIL